MTRPRPAALERTLTHRLHALNKLSDRVSQSAYLEAAGLPLGEGRCLAAIGAFEPLSVKDLARRANLDKAQASRAAHELVERGLVEKATNDADARGVVLALTASGRPRWAAVMRMIERRNEEIFGCLDEAERRAFGALLDRVLAHVRQDPHLGDERRALNPP